MSTTSPRVSIPPLSLEQFTLLLDSLRYAAMHSNPDTDMPQIVNEFAQWLEDHAEYSQTDN